MTFAIGVMMQPTQGGIETQWGAAHAMQQPIPMHVPQHEVVQQMQAEQPPFDTNHIQQPLQPPAFVVQPQQYMTPAVQPLQQPVVQQPVQSAPVVQSPVQVAPAVAAVPQVQDVGHPPQPPSPQLTIQALLRQFAKQPTCQQYSGDANKVKLLQLYLLLRQLTPNLSFELFLQLFAPLADADEKNLKHPDDAIDYYLPRTAKKASERNVRQWTSKDVVDYLALYVDIIREAENTGVDLPMTLNQFLASEPLQKQFFAGAFAEQPQAKTKQVEPAVDTVVVTPTAAAGTVPDAVPESAKQMKKKVVKKAKTESVDTPPTCVGQRVIYTMENGRQLRGQTTAYWIDEQHVPHVAIQADSGEVVPDTTIDRVCVCDDPLPNPPTDSDGTQLPMIEEASVYIPKPSYEKAAQSLALPVALGTVHLGEAIHEFAYRFSDGHAAMLSIVNGETGPYVDARLITPDSKRVAAESNPTRKVLQGVYVFELKTGYYKLSVSCNT